MIVSPNVRDGWRVQAEAYHADFDGYTVRLIATNAKHTRRIALFDVTPGDIDHFRFGAGDAVIQMLNDRTKACMRTLFPAPLPKFRIGTRPSPRRLAK
ncbi:hypothetical protein AKJ09_00046 [Labilithrix luteola]|uniref:Uncharacterized protein n=2 Tax=Labilithrix luteola TaxID=1391654 RepID=A0A0K1PIN9_9BACT|nr:hypothetical protein AKJ09_00046 [Labilithrix luteola]